MASLLNKQTDGKNKRHAEWLNYLFYPHPHLGKSRELIKMSPKKSRRNNQIKWSNQMNLPCRFCEEEETSDHLLFECPCFETRSQEMKIESIAVLELTLSEYKLY